MASSDGDSNFTNIVTSGTATVGGTLAVTGAATFSGGITGTITPAQLAVASGDGAITIQDSTVFITKGTAAALTLAAPTVTTHDGVIIRIVSTTAAAHTVTATTIGFNAADAAGDVGTFGGAIGDGLIVAAYQGEWYVLNNINVTIA